MIAVKLFAVVIVLAWVVPVAAQESRIASDWRREREHIAEDCSEVSGKALISCAVTLASWSAAAWRVCSGLREKTMIRAFGSCVRRSVSRPVRIASSPRFRPPYEPSTPMVSPAPCVIRRSSPGAVRAGFPLGR